MSHDDPSSASQFVVEDREYRRSGSLSLLARLYRPSGPGPFPAIVSVHGGRWVSQSRLTNEMIDATLAKAGILVMAIDFRMPPDVRYPAPIADIHFAIRWLKHHAVELSSSADLIGGLGTSSGGHQITLVAMRPGDPRYSSIAMPGITQSADLAFVVACWPVLDPLARYRLAKQKNMDIHIKSHDAYWSDESSMDEGSPQGLLDRHEPVRMPPLLLIQGTGDEVVLPQMTEKFAASYRQNGGEVSLETYAGQPHTFITNDPGKDASRSALSKIVSFIQERSASGSRVAIASHLGDATTA